MFEMLVALIVGGIAVWRITHMYQEETGPAAIFEKLRAKVWTMKDTNGGFREGFNCFKCMSIWHSIVFIIIYFTLQPLFWFLALMLSISAVSIFINEWYTRNE